MMNSLINNDNFGYPLENISNDSIQEDLGNHEPITESYTFTEMQPMDVSFNAGKMGSYNNVPSNYQNMDSSSYFCQQDFDHGLSFETVTDFNVPETEPNYTLENIIPAQFCNLNSSSDQEDSFQDSQMFYSQDDSQSFFASEMELVDYISNLNLSTETVYDQELPTMEDCMLPETIKCYEIEDQACSLIPETINPFDEEERKWNLSQVLDLPQDNKELRETDGSMEAKAKEWLKPIQETCTARARGPKVYEYLLRLLKDPVSNPKLIQFVDIEIGTFRLMDKDQISAIWSSRPGKKRSIGKLKYENFARNIRFHYKTRKMIPVTDKHLVYRFPPATMVKFNNNQIL